MSATPVRVLLIGFGNPGRGDDGLGPAFAEAVQLLNLPDVTVESDYQLNVEDAAAIAAHDVAVLVDADASGPEPFAFRVIEPKSELSVSTHSAEPGAVLSLSRDLFHGRGEAYILGIRGYVFEHFVETFTEQAADNLRAALDWFVPVLRARSFAKAAGAVHK